MKESSRRILVADDDPVIRHLVTSIVKKEGYAAVVVENGREAYRVLHRDADFKAAIFDMVMPHLEGIEVVRQMRTEKRLIRIPVIMITAEQDLKLIADILTAGATICLQKPFTPEQLQSVLRMLLSKSNRTEGRISAAAARK